MMNSATKSIIFIALIIGLGKSEPSSVALESIEDDSGSIEIPIRRPRSEPSPQRPILELVLGVLDTFHASAKSELRRIQARNVRQSAMALSSSTVKPLMIRIKKRLENVS